MENFVEMAPIIYTPTVGWVCSNYHKLYRRPRGMFFSAKDKGEMVSHTLAPWGLQCCCAAASILLQKAYYLQLMLCFGLLACFMPQTPLLEPALVLTSQLPVMMVITAYTRLLI
eukprot:GHRR01033358.1.p1 GENE.GHRR01033358.1~~GHRR01033358.1.p1  ORF type:complete len:114 (+),score=21.48 GHRR01033358.1:305-646(+)